MEEVVLIRNSQQGDLEALEQLLIRYEKKVYTIAYKYMGNPEDASDVAQEAMIRIYQSIGQFRGDASFGTWIGRITANCCLDALRRSKRVQVLSLDEEITLEEGTVSRELVDETATPEQRLLQQEAASQVHQALQQMKEEYRVVLVLRELEGYSYEEIAQKLSCSLGTIKSRIARGRQYLKEQLLQRKGGN